MTAEQLKEALGLESLCCPAPQKEVTGGYCGDLLSFVMGRASSGDAWVTIMTNINVVAVASLADTACVVLAENVPVQEDVVQTAAAKGVTLVRSAEPTFTVCKRIGVLLDGEGV